MRRTKEEAEITKRLIQESALKIFSQKGFSASNLDEIAKEAGVTRGAVYWHFDNKAHLFQSLIEKYSMRSSELMKNVIEAGGSIQDILINIFTAMLRAIEEEDDLRDFMEISLFRTEYTGELINIDNAGASNTNVLIETIAGAILQGQETGMLGRSIDPQDAARGYLALQNGLITLWLRSSNSFSLSRSGDSIIRKFIQGISV